MKTSWIATVLLTVLGADVARPGDIPIVDGVPPGYELVRLTDDPDFLHSVPDINDSSEVVFGKFVSANAVGDLYRFSDGVITQLTGQEAYDLNPVTNNVSQLAWITCVNSAGPFDVVSDYTEGSISDSAHPSGFIDMNDRGDIVWKHRRQPGVSEFDIYLYTHADRRVERLTDGGNNQSPRINNAGQVVWRWRDDSVSPWTGKILLYSDSEIQEVASDCQCKNPDISDDGFVVWINDIDLYLWDGEEARFLVSPAGIPKLNGGHEIAFGLWDNDEQIAKHALLKDGVIFVLPNYGYTTARSSLNNRSEVAMKNFEPGTGDTQLFLLRRSAPKGDFNHDCRVDAYDLWVLQRCGTAVPGPEDALLAECIRGDFDEDGDVDPTDWEAFIGAFTGAGMSIDECEP